MKTRMTIEIVLNDTLTDERCGCRLLAELIRQARLASRDSSKSWRFSVRLDDKGRAVLLGRSRGQLRVPQFIDCGCETTTGETHEVDPPVEDIDTIQRLEAFYGEEFKKRPQRT